jgi:hypothetical protein
MILPTIFSCPKDQMPDPAPKQYPVGSAVYFLDGVNSKGDLVYSLKKIPKRKSLMAMLTNNCCLQPDQIVVCLQPDQIVTDLSPDQGCS